MRNRRTPPCRSKPRVTFRATQVGWSTSVSSQGVGLIFQGRGMEFCIESNVCKHSRHGFPRLENAYIPPRQPHARCEAPTTARHWCSDYHSRIGHRHDRFGRQLGRPVLRSGAIAYPACPLRKRASLMVMFLGSSSRLQAFSIGDCCWAAFPAMADGGVPSWSLLQT